MQTKKDSKRENGKEMNNIISLFFTKNFQSEYEPAHLLLGLSIGIVVVVILTKKIIDRRNKK